ncbi:hypothetical protein XENOCAPTIV_017247 [Xenoophorus captivus]|uniref:Uncharacterized protein n=1 Tax=Xenoophorus captivus TaxID=1517983 RepID=A0ABV0QIS0_9TELE
MGVVSVDQLKALLHQYLALHQAHSMNVCGIDRSNTHESNMPDPDVFSAVLGKLWSAARIDLPPDSQS